MGVRQRELDGRADLQPSDILWWNRYKKSRSMSPKNSGLDLPNDHGLRPGLSYYYYLYLT